MMNYGIRLIKWAFFALLIHTGAFAQGPSGSLVDIARSTPELSTWVSAIQAAGLEEMLTGPGPFTVFAPTNVAFANLLPGALDNLLKPENKQRLLSVLNAHIVSGNLPSSNLVSGTVVKTVSGKEFEISLQGNKVKVNDAQVTKADFTATNGVIHLIDKVLMP
jgi:uncharacterized surface protein with fasciclin (FAS1) repeats